MKNYGSELQDNTTAADYCRKIVSVDEKVTTPAGTYEKCVHVRETTPLENDVSEKWYAPGVGMVKDVHGGLRGGKTDTAVQCIRQVSCWLESSRTVKLVTPGSHD